ncbi:type II/IV secretion system protein [Propionivibrio sp.]|uniref:GspE/PulE family protein n=1 Tax=Propionivibrio sp. TaxID=2212460 RepID=UPI0025E957E8|nr:type II/IV secretion system protein [Propionivibrio sp.]MBK7357415.1 Flp pilus assembly complex ATPase component TadA [Propionivibrio sp.]MBK8399847.1 Flp pilus assembly complex ATPase component TadA [Propionivibrio sp.]MBK8743263.1 Flp pilus assembly complex ATPase component TadA [Propionivibrio sp.]MBK8894722.1 Flp pilus assembly complex ATPase component TadA [Propionivibrio sp.]
MNATAPHHRPLGQILITKGILSEDQLRIALLEQMKSNQPVGKLLVSLGFVSEATLRDALSESLGKQSIDLSSAIIDPSALTLVPRDLAKRHHVLPLDYDAEHHRLTVAQSDINDIVALDKIRGLFSDAIEIDTLLAGETEIDRAIDQAYGYELSIDGILNEIETGEIDFRGLQSSADEYSQPVVRLIDSILTDAVKRESSDIHFEPETGFLRIRYRIDGMLRQVRSLHQSYWPAMAVRIKVMCGMNIAETRTPQDGRISLNMRGRQIDFRVSAQPTIHGENIVLRILDRQKGLVPLEGLGLTEQQLDQLKLMIARPEGIILVTGPTGSGKTTTLYSVLNHINSEGLNIMTLEDPVEYPMTMVRQTSVAESAKLDFANGIRSMMRQDPDVILVGEIRDEDTADMALRAAMTGHQVYSTLHTNSAIGAIPRLLDIGILPDIMAGNIIGIVAQRLVRRLCLHCKTPYQAEAHEARLLGGAIDTPRPVIFRPCGCERCDFQGYRGRLAIMELLRMNGDMDELVARRSTVREIRQLADRQGFVPLADDGLRRVLDGSTSIEEVARIVDLTDRM